MTRKGTEKDKLIRTERIRKRDPIRHYWGYRDMDWDETLLPSPAVGRLAHLGFPWEALLLITLSWAG